MRLLDNSSGAASTRGKAAGAAAPVTPRKADLIAGFMTGLDVITAFSDATPLLTASALAARLSISRAAARRFLITLNRAGYAATDGRSYWLTPKVLALGHSYLGSARLPRTVRPFLQQITAQTNESSNLALLDGRDVVYAARASAARLMSAAIETGTRLPAHTTAAGRVILAGMPRAQEEHWLAGATLAAHTAQTVTAKRVFAAEIRAARASGYAAVESQFEVGLRGIAVPLIGRGGDTVGALGISMAASSCPMQQAIDNCVPALRDAALQLRELL